MHCLSQSNKKRTPLSKAEQISKNLFDRISIPDLPQNLKNQFEKENIQRELKKIQEPVSQQMSEIKSVLTLDDIKQQIERIKIEEESLSNEPFERRIREAASKNKNMGLLLQKERAARIDLEKTNNGLERQIEELKLRIKLSIEPENDEKRTLAEQKAKIYSLEERISVLNLKLNVAEIDIAKCMKIIKSEVGDFQNLDELRKSDTGWKGRAQTIEILKSKIQKLKNAFGENKNGDQESASVQSFKKFVKEEIAYFIRNEDPRDF